MFPFKPKPPTLGGKLKRKRASENQNGLSMDPLAEGGPVEYAITKDLQCLMSLFRSNFQSTTEISTSELTNNNNNNHRHHHDGFGKSFSIFKAWFRRGKFAALHTRSVPPRSDREAYTQLIYSAAVSLCITSLEKLFQQTIDSIIIMSSCTHVDFIDSVCALFTLYALYETCPLPTVPPFPSQLNDPLSTLNIREKPHQHQELQDEDIQALSCLPMGLTSADDSKATFRRVYKSPIRINRRHYLYIHLLHDISLQMISYCERSKQIATITQESNMNTTGASSWKCSCSLASDCITIIQRMKMNSSFDLCEYCGPVSVEGLAGSKEYYQHIVLQKISPAITSTTIITNTTSTEPPVTHTQIETQPDIDHKQYDEEEEEVDISTLESYHSTYHEKITQLFRSEELQRSFGTGGQAQSLKSTLQPILEQRRMAPLTDQFNQMLVSLRSALGLSLPLNTHSSSTTAMHNDSNNNHTHMGESYVNTANISSIQNTHDTTIATTGTTATSSSTDCVLPFRLRFSPNISDSLKRAVETVMMKTTKTTISSGSTDRVDTTRTSTRRIQSYDDWLWNDILSSGGADDTTGVDNQMLELQNGKDYDHDDGEVVAQEEVVEDEGDDDISTSSIPILSSIGDSNNALQRLLSLAKYSKV